MSSDDPKYTPSIVVTGLNLTGRDIPVEQGRTWTQEEDLTIVFRRSSGSQFRTIAKSLGLPNDWVANRHKVLTTKPEKQ